MVAATSLHCRALTTSRLHLPLAVCGSPSAARRFLRKRRLTPDQFLPSFQADSQPLRPLTPNSRPPPGNQRRLRWSRQRLACVRLSGALGAGGGRSSDSAPCARGKAVMNRTHSTRFAHIPPLPVAVFVKTQNHLQPPPTAISRLQLRPDRAFPSAATTTFVAANFSSLQFRGKPGRWSRRMSAATRAVPCSHETGLRTSFEDSPLLD